MQNSEIKSGIYCIENINTNKKYIGQSVNIQDRWRKHKSELNHSNHDNDYLQNAWNKYGETNFKFYVLEYCNINDLNDKERYYIDLYQTLDRNLGYNMKSGGQDQNSLSQEIRDKISKSNRKAYLNSNLKEIRSNDALKQWANPKIKEKIMGENNGMYGKHHTKETREKMSEMKKGKLSPKRDMTPVLCEELNKVFDCAAIAAKETGAHSGCILQVCRGQRKTAGGYHWKFKLENNIC